MAAVQPHLDGTIPTPKIPAARRKAESFAAWVDEVRPTIVDIARSGRTFMFWEIEEEFNLPLAPDQAHHPGILAATLHRDGITRTAGYGKTRDKSAVLKWKGTRAVIEGRVA